MITLAGILALAMTSVAPPATPCPRGGEAVPCELRVFYDNPQGRVVRLAEPKLPISRLRDVEVWVETWTQYGKQWPQDQLKYQLGTERGCPGRFELTKVTPHRFRVHVISDQADECKLELRLLSPREVTLELQPVWETPPVPAPLPGEVYSRTDADYIVRRIYQGLLQREPDAGGYAAALADVQAGRVEAVILKMVQSPEYAQLHRGWNSSQMVQSLYTGILGRPADAEGMRAYQSRVARGEAAAVALEMLRSKEFSERMAARR